jgi:hypothetical protein
MKTLLIITPHMSTGGCPQVVAKKVELLREYYNVIVVEWECVAWLFVVQRNRVIDMIGNKFISLSDNKEYDLFNVVEDYDPEYIMIEEFSETFIPNHIMRRLYSKDRKYQIFETTHSSHPQPNWKRFLPDKFIFVSPYSLEVFKDMGVPMDLIEYPIEERNPVKEHHQSILGLDPEYKHVINVGLFTHGKNQGYAFEIARLLQDYKIQFHFIGNQAGNFIDYWKPIMETKPDNCIVWGERSDVDSFVQSCDVHLFTSRLELNPLSIKESLEYGKPTMIFDLHTYMGKYSGEKNINFLTGDPYKDAENLVSILGIEKMQRKIPKIKVVHLLLNPDEPQDLPEEGWRSTVEKQNFSLQCWEKMKNKFHEYVPRYTVVNRTELPYENCMCPEIINPSKELKNDPPVLTYGHYGAYKAHTEGIYENFDEDLDALIIAEGDSFTDLSSEDFYEKVLEAYYLGEKEGAKLISFAGPLYMTGGEYWNETKEIGNWLDVHHFLLGTTYMIMKSHRGDILEKIKVKGWHSPDLWLAWTYSGRIKMLTSKIPIVYQKEGYSVLDYKEKDTW